MKIEFEVARRTSETGFQGWPAEDSGISSIEVEGPELLVEGWYDTLAFWSSSVVLDDEQRRDLAFALLPNRLAEADRELANIQLDLLSYNEGLETPKPTIIEELYRRLIRARVLLGVDSNLERDVAPPENLPPLARPR